MADLPQNVGFIGLGAMGFPMVQNLCKKLSGTASIYIYDLSQEAVEALVKESQGKMHSCGNAAQVAERSDVILSMVPEGSHSKAVYLSADHGVLSVDCSHKLLLDCSTIDTATSLQIRDEVSKRHPTAAFFDAPVSGGVLGAEKGSLTFMVGCTESDEQWKRIEQLLSLMGSNIIACGGPSLGLTSKLCNNYCSGLIAIATSEAMNIGIHAGMDPRVLSRIFSTSLAQSCINDKWNPCPGVCPDAPASKGYKAGFKVGLMRKDFALAVDTAERVGAKLALGQTGLDVYTGAMNDERCKDKDSRVVYRYLDGDEDWAKRFQ